MTNPWRMSFAAQIECCIKPRTWKEPGCDGMNNFLFQRREFLFVSALDYLAALCRIMNMIRAVIIRMVICTEGRVSTERWRYSVRLRRRRRSLYLLYMVVSLEI